MAKAISWYMTDTQTRKCGDQTGLDTLVVHTVNDDHKILVVRSESKRKCLVIHLGSTSARMKLKGIDGGPHKRWSMWFNSKQRAEPYQALTSGSRVWRHTLQFGWIQDRCCMAVVSSCREMLG